MLVVVSGELDDKSEIVLNGMKSSISTNVSISWPDVNTTECSISGEKMFFFRQIIFSTRLKVENGPNKPNWWKIAKSKKKNGKNRSKHFSPKLQNFCEIQVDNNGNTNLNSFLLNTNFRKNRFSGCFFNFQLFNFKFPKKLFCL